MSPNPWRVDFQGMKLWPAMQSSSSLGLDDLDLMAGSEWQSALQRQSGKMLGVSFLGSSWIFKVGVGVSILSNSIIKCRASHC